jgi:hypothetical protein
MNNRITIGNNNSFTEEGKLDNGYAYLTNIQQHERKNQGEDLEDLIYGIIKDDKYYKRMKMRDSLRSLMEGIIF